jgi:hypothetical protein
MGPTTYDSRFPTCNTNLAACLAALRIPIKTQDPVWVVEEGEPKNDQKRIVTFFFEEQSAPNNDGYAIEQAAHIDWAWRHREEFEKENPEHPLIYMRRAIDKLEWLIDVKYGRIKIDHYKSTDHAFLADDIIQAACFMGSGYRLHSFQNDKFAFEIEADDYERMVEEFECFRHGKDPVCYMRKVLECRKLLIGLVKKAPVLLHYQNGDPFAGGREGYIAKGISPEKLNQFFEFLYE